MIITVIHIKENRGSHFMISISLQSLYWWSCALMVVRQGGPLEACPPREEQEKPWDRLWLWIIIITRLWKELGEAEAELSRRYNAEWWQNSHSGCRGEMAHTNMQSHTVALYIHLFHLPSLKLQESHLSVCVKINTDPSVCVYDVCLWDRVCIAPLLFFWMFSLFQLICHVVFVALVCQVRSCRTSALQNRWLLIHPVQAHLLDDTTDLSDMRFPISGLSVYIGQLCTAAGRGSTGCSVSTEKYSL